MTASPPALPSDLLAAAVRRNASAPLITHYDDATGERVELSATTLANWVAKTANLLQDEFDVGPGSTVAVALHRPADPRVGLQRGRAGRDSPAAGSHDRGRGRAHGGRHVLHQLTAPEALSRLSV